MHLGEAFFLIKWANKITKRSLASPETTQPGRVKRLIDEFEVSGSDRAEFCRSQGLAKVTSVDTTIEQSLLDECHEKGKEPTASGAEQA